MSKIFLGALFLLLTSNSYSQPSKPTDSPGDSNPFLLENYNDGLGLKENSTKPKPTPPWWVQRFRVSVGVFVPVNNTEIEVGNQQGTFGTIVNFEDDLGFSKSTATFLGDFQWRASRRSRFDLSFFHLNRDSHYKLKKDIEFADHTYPVDADVNSFFKTDIYRFSYGYAILTSPKYELGLMLGTHVVNSDVGIALAGSNTSVSYSDNFDFTAPLPDVGIWGGYAFSDKFAINGNISYLSLKINDIDGQIISYNFSLMYQALKNLDVALGYTGLNFKVDVEKERLQGYLKWGYNGPSLSASYAFGKKKW